MSLLLSLYSNIYYVITETDIKKDVFHLFMSMRRRKNSESYTCDKSKNIFLYFFNELKTYHLSYPIWNQYVIWLHKFFFFLSGFHTVY